MCLILLFSSHQGGTKFWGSNANFYVVPALVKTFLGFWLLLTTSALYLQFVTVSYLTKGSLKCNGGLLLLPTFKFSILKTVLQLIPEIKKQPLNIYQEGRMENQKLLTKL